MADDSEREFTGTPAAHPSLSISSRTVIWLSGLGVLFILLGMVTLTLPFESEGPRLWELNSQHSITLLDGLSTGLMGIGVGLVLVAVSVWKKLYGPRLV